MGPTTTTGSPTHQAQWLDGKAVGQLMQDTVKQQVATLLHQGVVPGLRVVQVGDVPASTVYVNKKARVAAKLGIDAQVVRLPETVPAETLQHTLAQLNNDPAVHAILLQLPLPAHLDPLAFQRAIAPEKDVDGFHPYNLGALLAGTQPYAVACTPLGVMRLLTHYAIELAGQHAVVIGRSNIVGKPMAHLLLQQQATVTVCHSKTQELPALVRQADVVVAAVGRPAMVRGNWIKPGAVVVDVGINKVGDQLVGDVAFEEASQQAGWITPVPGGVGPMTIAQLMQNTANLCQLAVN